MKRGTSVSIALVACALLWGLAARAQQRPAAAPTVDDGPRYANGTNLLRPVNYREWTFLSSSLGLTYQPSPNASAAPAFQNVFVNASSYRRFMETGTWPDKTIFVLEIRSSAVETSINKEGRFQAGLAGFEAEVKDSRFPDGWAFFAFGPAASPGEAVAPLSADRAAPCVDCHSKHTAVERTFVQFYPTLFEVAKRLGTVKSAYTDP